MSFAHAKDEVRSDIDSDGAFILCLHNLSNQNYGLALTFVFLTSLRPRKKKRAPFELSSLTPSLKCVSYKVFSNFIP